MIYLFVICWWRSAVGEDGRTDSNVRPTMVSLSLLLFLLFRRGLAMSTIRGCLRPGFSSLQFLVLFVLVSVMGGIAVGIAVPAILRARKAAAVQTTMDNLGQCARAVHTAHDAHGTFPPYYGVYDNSKTPMTFHAHLLPFVGQKPLYERLDATAVVPVYLSPLDPTRTDGGAGAINFPVNLRLFYTAGGLGSLSTQDNLIYPRMPNTFQMDGTSNTVLFATKYQHCGEGGSLWMDPGKNALGSITAAHFGGGEPKTVTAMAAIQNAPTREACDPKSGQAVSLAADSIHLAFCDASVRTLKMNFPHALSWQAILTPNALDSFGNPGWPVGNDWDR
jgi:hypothetical protein